MTVLLFKGKTLFLVFKLRRDFKRFLFTKGCWHCSQANWNFSQTRTHEITPREPPSNLLTEFMSPSSFFFFKKLLTTLWDKWMHDVQNLTRPLNSRAIFWKMDAHANCCLLRKKKQIDSLLVSVLLFLKSTGKPPWFY